MNLKRKLKKVPSHKKCLIDEWNSSWNRHLQSVSGWIAHWKKAPKLELLFQVLICWFRWFWLWGKSPNNFIWLLRCLPQILTTSTQILLHLLWFDCCKPNKKFNLLLPKWIVLIEDKGKFDFQVGCKGG